MPDDMIRGAQVSMVLAVLSIPMGRAISAARAADDNPIVIHSDERTSYDCRGGTAVVNGGDNVLSFRNCAEIIINGGDNVIDAGVVGAIKVLGGGNRIVWTEAASGKRPRITNLGEGNVVSSKPSPLPPDGKPTAKEASPPKADKRQKGAPDRAGASDESQGSCVEVGGRWEISGTCGTDVCSISQRGCKVSLRCRGGSAARAGSVSGRVVDFSGASGVGLAATCRGTVTGKTMQGTCTPHGAQGLVTCAFTARARADR
jgi:hypothetical protein